MSETGSSEIRLKVVALRGRNKGRFGWVLMSDTVLIQCLKSFASANDAESDAAAFLEQDTATWHRLH